MDAGILSLFGGGAVASSSAASLVQTLYGFGGQTSAAGSGQNPVLALQLAEKNEARDVARTAKQPEVARDVAAFRKAVAGAKDPAKLLANPDFMKVLLTANGLSDSIAYPALARKALMSDVNDKKS